MANEMATEADTIPASCGDITIVPCESDLTVEDLSFKSARMSLARSYMNAIAPSGFPKASSVAGFSCL